VGQLRHHSKTEVVQAVQIRAKFRRSKCLVGVWLLDFPDLVMLQVVRGLLLDFPHLVMLQVGLMVRMRVVVRLGVVRLRVTVWIGMEAVVQALVMVQVLVTASVMVRVLVTALVMVQVLVKEVVMVQVLVKEVVMDRVLVIALVV
jgi:hypothetical protein